jgi:beta-glucuronidase
VTPQTFIDEAWIRLAADGRIAVSLQLNGPNAANRRAWVRIPALGFVLRGRTGADGVWRATHDAPQALTRWSPETPTLYDVAFGAAGDTLRDRVGFRTIEVRGEDILLNGVPVFLRGICLHEEELGAEPVRNMTPQAAEALLHIAKHELHCNFVRLAHYPHAAAMTRAADKLGLMVWSEIPVYWRINWENEQTLNVARQMLAENIRRDRNRASIVLWSVANETPLGEARNAFLRTLIADARALDDTRLITAALLTERRDHEGRPVMVVNDPLAEQLDVLGVNTYNGWYSDDELRDLPHIGWRSDYGKPMVFSEFGADALAGFSDPELMRKFSEDFQAEYYRQTLAMSETIQFLRGLSPWILKDFRSPRRQHPVYQNGWNRKGVISETGVRKQAFAVLAQHYRGLIGG